MKQNYLKRIKLNLISNINLSGKPGMIIASPSDDPPYIFHWVRDASLVMKAIIDIYLTSKKSKYFKIILDNLENEKKIQELDTLTGLGEPKVRINCTPYNEPWGRPQNDGPALRGLNMIKLYSYFNENYNTINKSLIEIILLRDLNYLINNYNKPSFDLWEEVFGWNFYTRLVQFKFFKEFILLNDKFKIFLDVDLLNKIKSDLLKGLKDHISENQIISSFDKDGKIVRWDDASIIMGLNHVDYDQEIIDLFSLERFLNVSKNLLEIFCSKYKNSHNMIGRYKNDAYYNGHTWIICSLGISQFYAYLFQVKGESNFSYFLLALQVFNYILNIDNTLALAEQYDPDNNKQLSAKDLTWNYTELYFTSKIFNNISNR